MAQVLDRPVESSVGLRPMTYEEFVTSPDVGERDELVLGMLWPEMPEGGLHFYLLRFLERLFQSHFPEQMVSREVPLNIRNTAQPRPDLVVFNLSEDVLAPTLRIDSDHAVIVLEVAFSSLDRDVGPKDRQYAIAEIPEYVIVDLRQGRVEVRTEPTDRGYSRRTVLFDGDTYRGMAVSEILGRQFTDQEDAQRV